MPAQILGNDDQRRAQDLHAQLTKAATAASHKADAAQAAGLSAEEGYWTGVGAVIGRLADGLRTGVFPSLMPDAFLPRLNFKQGVLPNVPSPELPSADDNGRRKHRHDGND
jgi:hypothetical protein